MFTLSKLYKSDAFYQNSYQSLEYQYGPVTKKNCALTETDMHRVYLQIRNARQRHFLQGQGGN